MKKHLLNDSQTETTVTILYTFDSKISPDFEPLYDSLIAQNQAGFKFVKEDPE